MKLRRFLIALSILLAACTTNQDGATQEDFTEEMNAVEDMAIETASAATQQADQCEVYTSAFSFKTLPNMTLKVFRPAENDIATYETDANCTASVVSNETLDETTKAMLIRYGEIKCNFGESSQFEAVFTAGDNILVACASVPMIETVDPYASLDINGEQLRIWERFGAYNIVSTSGWMISSGDVVTLNGHDDQNFHVLYGDIPLEVPIEAVRFSRP